ncbi:hypothetical protein AAFF_G00359020 [Aldrovandia affinis]|uniref:PiggyBac transposable element-derived protein domain-containing protein n=1 Tax=Aldrovandia affinis TaxID=143900 RepID=A0AAD7WMZ0_9TELE|nr:hypothetical protein AAFF_G00359020 [Aldrovandia affinis]
MYKATMAIGRFEDISRFLRFDDKRTRAFRLETNHMAAFRYIWDQFLVNCRQQFISDCVTVDEQLVPFRGRSKFVQYMPSKPAKYGMKIFWICDARIPYAIDGINKPDVPPLMKASRSWEVHSAEFGFNGSMTMVSYVPKKGKALVLLSTMHHDKMVDENSEKKNPEAIKFYNKTKGSVDTMDQMIRAYTCKRQTQRWPMVLWYDLLDIATLNAYTLFTARHPDFHTGVASARRLFLKELSKELVTPHMKSRLEGFPQLQTQIVEAMGRCGVTKATTQPQERSRQGKGK